ncbi:Stk1 family PASTA domain-containing Ser/Thr kinase [Brevibacterium album]|uniref:Stk1 family PASTA domain-containing Ser/Thr kinase n=1 Tax=Brevibacterium album TaxID=417948 RepID=UPI000426094D|nr:Stk1 family PASTA domain-containing Ser/Thr kinase [Brevibacterium album]
MTTLTDPLIGASLDDRYRVDAPVARGGMAMVYRGTDLRLDRVVALKVMHRHLIDDDGFVERFQREARAAAGLFHPNLVAVHDTGRDGDAVYLVMEYLPNVTLRRELRHRGHLSPRQALVVLDAVLAGLEAVHSAGMIHRDLKPDNVLLGEDGKIKLADFGLARAVSSATTTKTLMGTVGYVAPELVTRTGADARTDLYTVGIMLYEMLTGEQPYTDDVPIRVAYRHVHDDVPAPSGLVPGLSPRLDALVLWATARDPEERPQSSTALREALAEARAELTPGELDLGSGELPAAALDETRPLLVPTATIRTAASADSGEVPRSTDEIPYLGAPAEGLDEEADAEGTWTKTSGPAGAAAAARDADPNEDAGEPAGAEASPAGPESGGAGPAPRRRGARLALILVAAVLVLGLTAAGLYLSRDRTATVPDVQTGQDPDEAVALIEEAGFEVETVEAHSDSVPAGRVLGADPAGGAELRPGDTVTLTLSQGEELFTVPDVTGSAEADARITLESSGMVLGKITREFSDEVPDGSVISQGVGGEEQVAKGTAVDLVVSRGVEPIEVPIVTGIDYESAFGRLARMGFKVSREDVFDEEVPAGKVVSQYPRGREERHEGDLIMLRVSKGPEAESGADDANGEEPAPAEEE